MEEQPPVAPLPPRADDEPADDVSAGLFRAGDGSGELIEVAEDGTIPGKHGGRLIALRDPERAREMQAKRTEQNKAKRAEGTRRAKDAAAKALLPAVEGAAEAIDSTVLDREPLDKVAEKIVRNMAKVILFGGEAFLPTNLKEAAEVAKVWEDIATKERLKNRPIDALATEVPAAEVARRMREMQRELEARKQAGV